MAEIDRAPELRDGFTLAPLVEIACCRLALHNSHDLHVELLMESATCIRDPSPLLQLLCIEMEVFWMLHLLP